MFDSFNVEDLPDKTKKINDRSSIPTNIYRVQAYDWVMCGNFCIGFIKFMPKGKA